MIYTTTTTILSTLRTLVGASLLLLPSTTASAFFLPTLTASATGTTILTRLAGSRDLVIGLYTLWAVRRARGQNLNLHGLSTSTSAATSTSAIAGGLGERDGLLDTAANANLNKDANGGIIGTTGSNEMNHLRTVLYANIAVDAIDVLSSLYCVAIEGLGLEPLVMVGGGAVLFLGLGVGGVMGMRNLRMG